MQATGKTYNFSDSLSRIDEILNSSDNNYEERNDIPPRSQLTFTNGFYVDCTAIFIDMCDSSSLPNKHTRPVIAKLYRCFISELVALLNGCDICREVNIHGDCVWGVFNTPYQNDINEDRSYKSTLISNTIYGNLNDHNKNLFNKNYVLDCYEGNIIWSQLWRIIHH